MARQLRSVFRFSWRRWVGVGLGAFFVACLATADVAHSQGFSWFGGILGGGTPQRSPPAPSYPGSGGGYSWGGGGNDDAYRRSYRRDYGDDEERAARRRARRKHAVEPTQDAAKKTPPKADATVFVDVFGDGFGMFLANGLDEALADRPEVAIVHKARGSTGIVNTAFYDWPKAIDDLLKSGKAKADKPSKDATKGDAGKSNSGKAETADKGDPEGAEGRPDGKKADKPERVDVAVMMVGSNDRQPIIQDGKTYQRGSDEWNAIYRKRVLAIAEAFHKRKIPLIWVGLPITKDDEFADDMAAFNEIYKDAAAKTGATYVDSWEVFSDDKGDFNAFGPDVNGQTVRLRTPDGIFFTHAGGRKLAHFVETHLRRDIDGKIPPPQLPTAEAPSEPGKPGETDKSAKKPSVALAKPEAGPIKNLGDPPSAKDGALLQIPAAESVVTVAGRTEGAPANRADNFRWAEPPPKSAPAAASPTPAKPAPK